MRQKYRTEELLKSEESKDKSPDAHSSDPNEEDYKLDVEAKLRHIQTDERISKLSATPSPNKFIP